MDRLLQSVTQALAADPPPGLADVLRVAMEAVEHNPHLDDKRIAFDGLVQQLLHRSALPAPVAAQLAALHRAGALEGVATLVCGAARGLVDLNRAPCAAVGCCGVRSRK